MMKIVADKDIPFVKEYFSTQGELLLKPGRALKKSDVKEADMLLVRSVTEVGAELLAGSAVKFVGSVTSGLDHLDLTWLKEQGIELCAARGFNAEAVADYVVSVIAAAQRRQALSTQRQRAVVIGVGEVGSRVCQRLKALRFEVQLCDPLRAANETGFTSIPLDQISDVDVICVHTPLTKDGAHPTYHMIDESFLERQAKGALLINAGRGEVIKSDALKTHGTHLFWCFDVWEGEPAIDPDIVRGALFATPHIAGYSVQAKRRGIAQVFSEAVRLGLLASKRTQQPEDFPQQTLGSVDNCNSSYKTSHIGQNRRQFSLNSPRYSPQTGNDFVSMPSFFALESNCQQTLAFSGRHLHWQDIVMGIFNPLVMTAMLREVFLVPTPDSARFDALRRDFNYRHEFAYTTIRSDDLLLEDRLILEALKINIAAGH